MWVFKKIEKNGAAKKLFEEGYNVHALFDVIDDFIYIPCDEPEETKSEVSKKSKKATKKKASATKKETTGEQT